MADVKEQRIFAAEQIVVPDDFPGLLKNYVKSVIKGGVSPEDLVRFSREHFEERLRNRGYEFPDAGDEEGKVKVTGAQFVFEKEGNFRDSYKIGQ